MLRSVLTSLRMLLVVTIVVGVLYPLVVWGIGQVAFSSRADGSLVLVDGEPVGSSLIGQAFEGLEWFVGRPDAFDPSASAPSNLGPSNPALGDAVRERLDAVTVADDPAASVPVDAVTGSGSGLDPHISPAYARLQAPRVAAAARAPRDGRAGPDRRPHRGSDLGVPRRAPRQRPLAQPRLGGTSLDAMKHGELRIYVGYAAGVGKTFAMLGEGHRRRDRGTDVVVGFVEPHERPLTWERIGDLEVVPRRRIEYRGSVFEEMDVDAILTRAPEVALVDELAHTNVPGSRNEKRWQDVDELLAAGIDVISTVNIQHFESLNDVVERITGVAQRETVPDEVVRRADQQELVDMTPYALRRRMAHGNIYPSEKIDAALSNYFREGNLGALRELALLWMADRVDESLQDYMKDRGIEGPWEARETDPGRYLGASRGRGARPASRADGGPTRWRPAGRPCRSRRRAS